MAWKAYETWLRGGWSFFRFAWGLLGLAGAILSTIWIVGVVRHSGGNDGLIFLGLSLLILWLALGWLRSEILRRRLKRDYALAINPAPGGGTTLSALHALLGEGRVMTAGLGEKPKNSFLFRPDPDIAGRIPKWTKEVDQLLAQDQKMQKHFRAQAPRSSLGIDSNTEYFDDFPNRVRILEAIVKEMEPSK